MLTWKTIHLFKQGTLIDSYTHTHTHTHTHGTLIDSHTHTHTHTHTHGIIIEIPREHQDLYQDRSASWIMNLFLVLKNFSYWSLPISQILVFHFIVTINGVWPLKIVNYYMYTVTYIILYINYTSKFFSKIIFQIIFAKLLPRKPLILELNIYHP